MYPMYEEEFSDFLDEEADDLEWESSIVHDVQDMWRSLPPDVRQMLIAYAQNMWKYRASILPLLLGRAYFLIRRYRYTPYAAVQQAGRQLGLRPRRPTTGGKRGMSPVQVKAYQQRLRQRLPISRIKRRYNVRRY